MGMVRSLANPKSPFKNSKEYTPLETVKTGELVYAQTYADLIKKIDDEYRWREEHPGQTVGITVFREAFTQVDISKLQTGELIKADELNLIIDEMNKIGAIGMICDCNCNYCSCNCNYCGCNCNWCTCNCNWGSCYHTSEYSKKLLEKK